LTRHATVSGGVVLACDSFGENGAAGHHRPDAALAALA